MLNSPAHTQINPEIGITTPDLDCIAVSLLSEAAQQQIVDLLSVITQRLGDAVWPMPAHALHTTLCEIIKPKPYIEDKTELLKNVPHYEQVLADALPSTPITVHFNRIKCSPQAIIVRGEDDGTFNHIREQLVPRLPLPAETKQPPDIIHSSIARFAKEITLAEVQAALADLTVDFTEVIEEFQLIRESAPFLVSYSVARRFPLA